MAPLRHLVYRTNLDGVLVNADKMKCLRTIEQERRSLVVFHSAYESRSPGALISAVDRVGCTARDLSEEKGIERTIKALDGELSTGYIYESRLILL